MKPTVNFEEIQVDSNTAAFACQTEKVISLTLTVIPYFCNLLNWPGSAINLLLGLIRLLGDDREWVEIRHRTLGADIYPSKSVESRENSIMHSLRVLKEAQLLSGFSAVAIRDGGGKRKADGTWKGIPTAYKLDQVYPIYSEVQDKASQCDLLSLPNGKCQMKLNGILNNIKHAHGYQAIARDDYKGESMEKEKKKEAEVITIAKIDDLGQRITLKDVQDRIGLLCDGLFECGQHWLNLGCDLNDFTVKLHARFDQNEIRLLEACKRSNKPKGAK